MGVYRNVYICVCLCRGAGPVFYTPRLGYNIRPPQRAACSNDTTLLSLLLQWYGSGGGFLSNIYIFLGGGVSHRSLHLFLISMWSKGTFRKQAAVPGFTAACLCRGCVWAVRPQILLHEEWHARTAGGVLWRHFALTGFQPGNKLRPWLITDYPAETITLVLKKLKKQQSQQASD